jgi:hypothetical protein
MAGSYSDSHPLFTSAGERGDMTWVYAPRSGGGYDPAADGGGFQFPDPDMIRGMPVATMTPGMLRAVSGSRPG